MFFPLTVNYTGGMKTIRFCVFHRKNLDEEFLKDVSVEKIARDFIILSLDRNTWKGMALQALTRNVFLEENFFKKLQSINIVTSYAANNILTRNVTYFSY